MSPLKHNSDDVALSLTLAVVASSPASLLLLDGDLAVVAVSLSFCEAFEVDPVDLEGVSFFDLRGGDWGVRPLREVLAATLSSDASSGPREIDLVRSGRATRHLIVQAQRLSYLDLEQTRILVAISDVTDARADAALREC